MKSVSLIIAFFLSGSLIPAKRLSSEKPTSFISDPSRWFPRESREALEEFLTTRSDVLEVDVYLLLEPPLSQSSEEAKLSLQELGNSWSKKCWAIISYRPGQIGAPMIVTGGQLQEGISTKFWEEEVRVLQDLSVQTWGPPPDLDFLARSLSDSLIFTSRAQNTANQDLIKNWRKEGERKYREAEAHKALLISLSVASLILLILAGFLWRRLSLKHRKMTFPETRWSLRLQAPHSGGTAVKKSY